MSDAIRALYDVTEMDSSGTKPMIQRRLVYCPHGRSLILRIDEKEKKVKGPCFVYREMDATENPRRDLANPEVRYGVAAVAISDWPEEVVEAVLSDSDLPGVKDYHDVEAAKGEKAKEPSEDVEDLSSFTREQLYNLAREMGLEGLSKASKDELVEAIEEARERIAEEDAEDDED